MSDQSSTPRRVAVVGAGPAGMYAVGHLLGLPRETFLHGGMVDLGRVPVEIDVIDRLPTPYGLVRGGVAPDHGERTLVADQFERMLNRPEVRFLGNIEVGRDVSADDLAQWYDSVLYTVGAPEVTPLGLPGEELPGSVAAHEVVGWYNAHPDHADLPLELGSVRRAVVVGTGNVAIDIARVLSRPVDDLATTDIADHALAALRSSAVEEVVLLARRGPAQVAFTTPELEQLAELSGIDLVVEGADLADEQEAAGPEARRKRALLREIAGRPRRDGARRIVLRFRVSPVALLGDDRVAGVRVAETDLVDDDGRVRAQVSDRESVLDAELVVRATGHRGRAIDGLPFDEGRGTVPHHDGRVEGRPGTYVAGWIKRGATGIIGTNKKCARDTVLSMVSDLAVGITAGTAPAASAATVGGILRGRRPGLVTTGGWRAVDAHERTAGRTQGRPG